MGASARPFAGVVPPLSCVPFAMERAGVSLRHSHAARTVTEYRPSPASVRSMVRLATIVTLGACPAEKGAGRTLEPSPPARLPLSYPPEHPFWARTYSSPRSRASASPTNGSALMEHIGANAPGRVFRAGRRPWAPNSCSISRRSSQSCSTRAMTALRS